MGRALGNYTGVYGPNSTANTVVLPAGRDAINSGDVVALGGYEAQLYSIKNMDFATPSNAGATAIATTTVTTTPASFLTRKRALFDSSTNEIFYANTYLTGPVGCRVWKYSGLGALLTTVTLDTGGGAGNYVEIMLLSNGNILVFWWNQATPYSIYFAIIDKNLNIVVAKTLIASANTNPGSNATCIALSGGGFAMVFATANVGTYFAVRNNAGAVVYGPTLISGGPAHTSGNSLGPNFKLAELSNGNIFVGISDSSQASSSSYVIYTPTGTTIKAYTTFTLNSGSSNNVELAVLNGFICMVGSQYAYVLDNSGTVQGTPYSLTISGASTARIITDGTYFWVFYLLSSVLYAARFATSGATPVVNVTPLTTLSGDVLYERSMFIVNGGQIFTANSSGVVTYITGSSYSPSQVIGGFTDWCALHLSTGTFTVYKILPSSIVGVAAQSVAAGNPGTPIAVIAGPAALITNAISGTAIKTIDHSAGTILGVKGTFTNGSAILKGFV